MHLTHAFLAAASLLITSNGAQAETRNDVCGAGAHSKVWEKYLDRAAQLPSLAGFTSAEIEKNSSCFWLQAPTGSVNRAYYIALTAVPTVSADGRAANITTAMGVISNTDGSATGWQLVNDPAPMRKIGVSCDRTTKSFSHNDGKLWNTWNCGLMPTHFNPLFPDIEVSALSEACVSDFLVLKDGKLFAMAGAAMLKQMGGSAAYSMGYTSQRPFTEVPLACE